jgi:hypothetical protein
MVPVLLLLLLLLQIYKKCISYIAAITKAENFLPVTSMGTVINSLSRIVNVQEQVVTRYIVIRIFQNDMKNDKMIKMI